MRSVEQKNVFQSRKSINGQKTNKITNNDKQNMKYRNKNKIKQNKIIKNVTI